MSWKYTPSTRMFSMCVFSGQDANCGWVSMVPPTEPPRTETFDDELMKKLPLTVRSRNVTSSVGSFVVQLPLIVKPRRVTWLPLTVMELVVTDAPAAGRMTTSEAEVFVASAAMLCEP